MKPWRLPLAGVCLWLLAGCAPALNWRDVPLPDIALKASFPCRPKVERQGGSGLARCEAAGQVFAVAWQVTPNPEAAKAALRASVAQFDSQFRVAGVRQAAAVLPKGALEWPESGQFKWPQAQTKIWVRGLVVVQGTSLGGDAEAAVIFLDALRTQD